MIGRSPRAVLLAFALAVFALLPAAASAAGDAQLVALQQRLAALQADTESADLAVRERLAARDAVAALEKARRNQREAAAFVADRRVEIAETVVRTGLARREADRLDRQYSQLLVEASRREAERARAEAERLRVQAQIHAEETERLRQLAEEEAQARAEAETALEGVSSREAARLRAARARAAELARQEAELLKSLESDRD